jgi:hypothetical protein
MRYEPKVGKEFPVTRVEENTRYLTEFTRSALAIVGVVVGMLALLVTASICAYRGDFGPLLTVWAVVGPMLTWIFGYYFRGSDQGHEDHTSTA